MTIIETNLKSLGILLPEAVAPVANYVPYVVSGNLIFISGQVSLTDTGLITGTLGKNLSLEDGQQAARACGLHILAQLKKACESQTKSLDHITRVIRLGGFVASTEAFTDHPKVINGASDLMVNVFGEKGQHARAAVGSSSLPLGAAVEVDGIFEIG